MINYVQKFAGGKVSIEVSDPADIYNLSTLYADGSEARVVDVDSGLYRLINGAWTYVPGSGGIPTPTHSDNKKVLMVRGSEYHLEEPILIVNLIMQDGIRHADKSYETVLEEHNAGKLILFRDSVLGTALVDYSDGLFVARFMFYNTSGTTITEFGVLLVILSAEGLQVVPLLVP